MEDLRTGLVNLARQLRAMRAIFVNALTNERPSAFSSQERRPSSSQPDDR